MKLEPNRLLVSCKLSWSLFVISDIHACADFLHLPTTQRALREADSGTAVFCSKARECSGSRTSQKDSSCTLQNSAPLFPFCTDKQDLKAAIFSYMAVGLNSPPPPPPRPVTYACRAPSLNMYVAVLSRWSRAFALNRRCETRGWCGGDLS